MNTLIDPMTSLAFSVYSNKGVYALLLGSGVSRASSVLTGWEIVLDLIRKVAELNNENCEPDPEVWFKTKYRKEPNYSELLDEVVKTPSERQNLLRSYFEPTAEEREQGLKLPNPAHKAIANLAAGGYLRIILTTNFDRLMEQALDEVGITPTVISSPNQIAGVMPLVHSAVTVIKLNGDYLDTRFKNTELELTTYDEDMNKLLDRILDEYGLIISGWSGDWDIALRSAIERCPNHRFSTFWTYRNSMGENAKTLAQHRKATIVEVPDAASLFEKLAEKVQALNDIRAPHPLSAKIAIATVKRHLEGESSTRIRLRDLVHEETEKLFSAINTLDFDYNCADSIIRTKEFMRHIRQCNVLSETLLSILITGCYWGSSDVTHLWTTVLQRIVNQPHISGCTDLLALRQYPALLLLYGAGIASLAGKQYSTFSSILIKPIVQDKRTLDPCTEQRSPSICSHLIPFKIIDENMGQVFFKEKHRLPANDYLYEQLREPFREYFPNNHDYEEIFAYFEYLRSLVYADLERCEWGKTAGENDGWWGPPGRFLLRRDISQKVDGEIKNQGNNWPILRGGLFNGSLEQLKTAKTKFDRII